MEYLVFRCRSHGGTHVGDYAWEGGEYAWEREKQYWKKRQHLSRSNLRKYGIFFICNAGCQWSSVPLLLLLYYCGCRWCGLLRLLLLRYYDYYYYYYYYYYY